MDRDTKQQLVKRLKSVEGHVRGVARMVDEDAYCIDVVHQISAVEKALQKVSAMVLDQHLHSCVTTAIQGDDPRQRERVLGEILAVFEGRR